MWGDPYFYHYGANLLADGKGFVAPLLHIVFGRDVQAADHPPLYLLYLAVPSVLGFGTVRVHMVWSALGGAGTVVACGLLGRRVAGERAGIVAAVIAALYPNLWVYDGQVLSETLAILVATVALLLAYRAWEAPTARRFAVLGAACGAAALSRSELALLVPALCWPLAYAPGGAWRTRARRAGVATVAALLVVAPWVGFNLARFERPVLLSSQLEATLAGANCDDTYHGPAVGLVTPTCLEGIDRFADQSVIAGVLRARARSFVGDHLGRVPYVVGVRVARVLGVYHPSRQLDVDVVLEGRPRAVATAGLLSAYVVELAAIAGLVVLVRRRARARDAAPVFPLLILPAIVLVTVALTYGTNRFRAVGETSLVVLAAVAFASIRPRPAPGPEPRSAA